MQLMQDQARALSRSHVQRHAPSQARCLAARLRCRSQEDSRPPVTTDDPAPGVPATTSGATDADLSKEITRFSRQAAATFAPRASTATKNPAVRGSALYNVFEVQAWASLGVGALLSFNVLAPTDEPSIARLMGMWSIWMFTIPSLRARECSPTEKDALNLLFLLVPALNVALPFVWKSFPFIFVADVVALGGVYAWKGVWRDVYGLPLGGSAAAANDAGGRQ